MKLSFITDEFTQSFDQALAFAKAHGLQGLELRSVDDRPIHDFTPAEAESWKKQLDDWSLAVPALSASFFKCEQTRENACRELEKLTRLCDLADALDCRNIRGFSFFAREGSYPAPETLARWYEDAAALLLCRGKRLLLEADPSVNTPNHGKLAALLEKLDSRCFGAVYDPGNDLFSPCPEEPYPQGYEAIAPYLFHVHIKDVVPDERGLPRCVAPGQGNVGFRQILSRLKASGYDGWLSLEPHYRKNTRLTEEQMRLPAGAEFSEGGREAMEESVLALKELLHALSWEPEA